MKKFLLATVSILALSSVARASDLPAKARTVVPDSIPLWAGGYVGIQGGVARHDAFIDTDCLFDCATISRTKTGGAIGGLLGYNFQRGSFVYGLEGDWNRVRAKVDHIDVFKNQTSNDVKWLATVRGRAGLAIDATLVYFTGGLAFGNVKNSFIEPIFGTMEVFASFSESKTRVGWTAGVGVEHMFSPHWTARAEFRYVDLGKTDLGCTSPTFTVCTDFNYRGGFSNTLMMGLIGLAYKF
jgi:outer membrane immunogenic protein